MEWSDDIQHSIVDPLVTAGIFPDLVEQTLIITILQKGLLKGKARAENERGFND